MPQAKSITVYFMRVDRKTGTIYQGYLGEIRNTLRAFRRYVGYNMRGMNIETASFDVDFVLIFNKYGHIYPYPPNRTWVDRYEEMDHVIMGNALVVRYVNGAYTSVKPSDVQRIRECLAPVETYLNGRLALILDEEVLPKYEEVHINANANE